MSPTVYGAVLVTGVALVLALSAWKPQGVIEDLTLLTATMLLLAPKLHCGYFSLLVLMMAPLLRRYRIEGFYFLFGLLALVADMYKWPVQDYTVAFWLMVGVFVILVTVLVQMRWRRRVQEGATGR